MMAKPMYKVGVFDQESESEAWMEARLIEGYVLESVVAMPLLFERSRRTMSIAMRFAPDEAYAQLKASVATDGGDR